MALIKMKVEDSKINDIGDAIREKTGSSQLYTIDEMPAAIRSISSSTWYSGPVIPEPDGTTYTVRIDLEKMDSGADQSTWGEWIDDAVDLIELPPGGGENGVDALMGYYPCAVNMSTGEEIAKLQPNNYRKTLDGQNINADYVMIYYPARGMRMWYEDSTHLCISITTADNKAGYSYPLLWGDRVEGYYISAYQSIRVNNVLYSKRSDQYLPCTISFIDLVNHTYNLNQYYCYELSLYAWTYLACCAFIKYKGKTVTQGLGTGVQLKMYPGGMDTHGLNNVTSEGFKIFGLERLLNCYYSTHLGGTYASSTVRTVSNGNFYRGEHNPWTTNSFGNIDGYSTKIELNTSGSGTRFVTRPSDIIRGQSSAYATVPFLTFFQKKGIDYESDVSKSFGAGTTSNNLNGRHDVLQGGGDFFMIYGMSETWAGEDMYNGRFMLFKPRLTE